MLVALLFQSVLLHDFTVHASFSVLPVAAHFGMSLIQYRVEHMRSQEKANCYHLVQVSAVKQGMTMILLLDTDSVPQI